MKKIYAEIGFGNSTFLSTEIEEGDSEYRVRGFLLPKKVKEFYFRVWVLKKVFIFSTFNGFRVKTKNKNNIKILFGIGGESIT